jgi:hypothetical protein
MDTSQRACGWRTYRLCAVCWRTLSEVTQLYVARRLSWSKKETARDL